jgi:hypothetical protein
MKNENDNFLTAAIVCSVTEHRRWYRRLLGVWRVVVSMMVLVKMLSKSKTDERTCRGEGAIVCFLCGSQ